MLTKEMKPGDRLLLELVCFEDREGRTKVTVDILEKRPAVPAARRRRKIAIRDQID